MKPYADLAQDRRGKTECLSHMRQGIGVIDGFVSLLRLLEFVPAAAREAHRQSGGRASQIKLKHRY
jgi:hypothetical protein